MIALSLLIYDWNKERAYFKSGGVKMGELIFALFVGLWMVFVGAFMNIYLTKEEKRERAKKAN